MRKIYIVLTFSGSVLSTLIKCYTRKKYSHVSIALDENLNNMYSFGRLHPYNPFWGGFVHEIPNQGTYKRFKNTISKIYSLEITENEYRKIKKTIKKFEKNKKIYRFNMIGLSAVVIHKKIKRKNYFYCAEFVKYLFDNAGINCGLPEIVQPADFERINNLNFIYSGKLIDYNL